MIGCVANCEIVTQKPGRNVIENASIARNSTWKRSYLYLKIFDIDVDSTSISFSTCIFDFAHGSHLPSGDPGPLSSQAPQRPGWSGLCTSLPGDTLARSNCVRICVNQGCYPRHKCSYEEAGACRVRREIKPRRPSLGGGIRFKFFFIIFSSERR